MAITIDEHAIVTSLGFYRYEVCRCSGILQHKYKSKIYTLLKVIVYPDHKSFRISKSKNFTYKTIATGKSITLNETLKTITEKEA